jgi:hypothetical protein
MDRLRTVPSSPDQPRHGRRIAGPVPAVPEPFIRSWESAYKQYGHVNEMAGRLPSDDPAAAWQMATASWEVAERWREIAGVVRLPWWLLAAVESAAAAFEAQARYWDARENSAESDSDQPVGSQWPTGPQDA